LKRELEDKNAQLVLKDKALLAQAALLSQRDYPQALQNSTADLHKRVAEPEESVKVRGH
jgi:hypothetical protein